MHPPELAVARQAALEGGRVVAKYFRQAIEVHGKQSFNLVTTADVESERAIVAAIRSAFPSDAILGEEGTAGSLEADRLWVVDPLDGTNNFAHGLEQFAVSIGFYEHGQPKVGVVYHPTRGEWYWSVVGEGAYRESEQNSATRMLVSTAERLDQSLIGCGFFYDRGAMMEATLKSIGDLFRAQIHGIRRFGAASLDLCMVASGALDGFFEYELAPWDFAAGRLILSEAGGRLSDCLGEPLPMGRTSILASNSRIHSAMLAIVKENLPAK